MRNDDEERNAKPITVQDLINHLQSFPKDIPVCFAMHSEYKLMRLVDVTVEEMQPHRPDGWVASRWSGKPVLPTIKYAVFPGN